MGTIGRPQEFGFVTIMKRRAALPSSLSVSLAACLALVAVAGVLAAQRVTQRGSGTAAPRAATAAVPAAPTAASSAGTRASASGDLIVNGGFENGLAGWEYDPEFQIASDKTAAHSGAASIQVEVTREAKWRTLKQKVQVRKGASYTLDVWIRGQAGAPRLWVLPPGGTKPADRLPIGGLKVTGKDWNEMIATFDATADGQAEIEIVINRFKDAAKAHVWIDDVSLTESKTSAMTPVSGGAGVNDEPAMARASDGSLYVAWVSFRDGCDTLQVARYRRDGEAIRQQKGWQLAGGKGAYVLWPRVVAAGGGIYVLYSSEINGAWKIVAVPCGAEGPGQPVTVTDGDGVGSNEKPAGVWASGALWVAWEGNRNQCRQVFVASLKDGKVSAAEALSRPGVSSYDPAIAALAAGSTADARVAVAWHSFIDNNYDIYLRIRSAQGEWEAERRLTKAPTIDRHAELAARGGDLWIVYENAQMKADYSIGGTKSQGLVVARVGTEGLESPASAGKSPVAAKSVAAVPVFDDMGRLWIAFQRPSDREWFPYLAGFNGGGWEPARLLSSKKASIERRAPLVIDGDRAIIAFQTDDLAGRYPDEKEATEFTSDIFLTSVALKDAAPASAMTFAPLAESPEEFAPGALRVEYAEESHGPSIDYKGQKLNLYYGDLHDHTNVSICGRTHDEAIDEAYQDMRDITHLDFACCTDHGYNQTPYLWNYTAKMARVNEDPGRFLTFLAEEWTSTFEQTDADHPFGFYGHRNLIFADPYFPRWWNEMNGQTPAQVWEELRKMKANFVYIPHQLADNGNVPTDWKFADEVAQPVAEIFQGRGSYEYRGTPRQAKNVVPSGKYFLQDAWAMGVVIGVIASPDHSGGKGKACVYAPSLTREAILDALRARHCFGTTAAKIFLDVRVNGALMGEKIATPSGKPVEVKVVARGAGDIAKIEVCRNNKFIYTTTPAGREAGFTYVDQSPLSEPSYYYVRLIQKDEEIAWSSPVWLGFGGSLKTN